MERVKLLALPPGLENLDNEIYTMLVIVEVLDRLDVDARGRVLRWCIARWTDHPADREENR